MKKLLALLMLLAGPALAQNPGVIYSGAAPAANDCAKFINRSLVTTTGGPCAGSTSFANPTATISTSAVNGVATTAMRSDAAPALASTIVAGGPTGSSSVIPVITWNAAGQLTAVTSAAITTPTGANPTAAISTSAVNGVAATFMRSDAAPALASTIAAAGPIGSATVVPIITFNAAGQLTTVSSTTITQPTGANPTASIGLTAVNGSAATFMRSDGAPPLDVTAAYAFTNLGATVIATSGLTLPIGSLGAPSLKFSGDTAGWFRTTNGWIFETGGNTPRLQLISSIMSFDSAEVIGWANGNATASMDTRISRNSAGSFLFDNNSTSTFSLTAAAAATLQFGAAAAASPVAQTFQAQGSRSGTDNDIGGAALTIRSGVGTGIGTRSVLTLQSPVVVASGNGAQTQTTGWRVDGGTGVSTGYAVAALPATPLTGARAHVTDALNAASCVFFAAIVAGGTTACPVFYNGAAWVGG